MDEKNVVLVVDDDTSNLMELTHSLRPFYKVYAVKDGNSALRNANEYSPDVILLDVVMPNMSGFEVLSELKSSDKTKDIPVIFITGMKDSVDEVEGLTQGAVDYIRKPFNIEIVKFKINQQIEIIKLKRDLKDALAALHSSL